MSAIQRAAWCLLLASCWGCGAPSNEYAAPPPPKVRVAAPIVRPIIQYVEENGETEAVERSVIRSRVQGFIEEVKFQPGQDVNKDDVLYVIEKDQYQAARTAAAANLASATAAIGVAQAQEGKTAEDFARQEKLKEQRATSQAEYDAAKAAWAAAKAAVKTMEADEQRAKADLEQAELDLRYTTVKALITGKVTKTNVKLGNLVKIGDELASIVDDREMFVNFSMSDREAQELSRSVKDREDAAATQGEDRPHWRGRPVYMRMEIDDQFRYAGQLDYIDQEGIDRETGTLGLRARFDNSEDDLVPGLFVRVRVPVEESPSALLIPERATGKDDMGEYVLLVDSQNTIARQRVELGQQVSGWVVVVEGLSTDDRVVIDGVQHARPGSEVEPEQTAFGEDELPPEPPPLPELKPGKAADLPAAEPAAPVEPGEPSDPSTQPDSAPAEPESPAAPPDPDPAPPDSETPPAKPSEPESGA